MIQYLWSKVKSDKRYWQFPIALSILTAGSTYGNMRLLEVAAPLRFTIPFLLLWIFISTLVAWLLLLWQEGKREKGRR